MGSGTHYSKINGFPGTQETHGNRATEFKLNVYITSWIVYLNVKDYIPSQFNKDFSIIVVNVRA